jgi:hypothetical protein
MLFDIPRAQPDALTTARNELNRALVALDNAEKMVDYQGPEAAKNVRFAQQRVDSAIENVKKLESERLGIKQ